MRRFTHATATFKHCQGPDNGDQSYASKKLESPTAVLSSHNTSSDTHLNTTTHTKVRAPLKLPQTFKL